MKTALSIIKQLHNEAICIVGSYKKLEIQLVYIIGRLDQHKVYRSFGYASLFQYLVSELGLTDEVAYTFINVSRKAREIPSLQTAIEKKEISISKAKRICSVIKPENQSHWLKLAQTLSKRELEREVAAAKPSAAIIEKAEYVPPDLGRGESANIRTFESQYPEPGTKPLKSVRIQLQLGLSEGLMIRLRKVQDLLSSKIRTSATLENTLEALVDHGY